MNVARGMADEFGDVALGEDDADGFVIPQPICAKTIEPQEQADKQDEIGGDVI